MLITIARRNMLRYKRKSMAALLSIITAFISLSLFQGYLFDVRQLYREIFSKKMMLGDLVIERKNPESPGRSGVDDDSLSASEMAWLDSYLQKHQEQVENRVRFLNINGFIASGPINAVYLGLAYDVEEGRQRREERFNNSTVSGVHLDQARIEEPMLLGTRLAQIMGCKIIDKNSFECPHSDFQLQVSTETAKANAMDLRPVGIISTGFADADQYFVMLPIRIAEKLYDSKRVSYVTVKLKEEAEGDSFIANLNAAADEAGIPIAGIRWTQHSFGDIYKQSMDFLGVFRNLIVSIVLVIVITSVLNTFIKSVHERLTEIGTLRSIGYQPHHVLTIFCSEAIILALMGSLGGIFASYGIAALVNAGEFVYKAGFLSEGVIFRIALQPFDFLWIGGLMMILTVASTSLATWKATKQSVSELLVDR